jgi:diacylglycerol kinase family enzyme
VTVESDGGLPVEVDGTRVRTAPTTARLSVVPAAVRAAYPRE